MLHRLSRFSGIVAASAMLALSGTAIAQESTTAPASAPMSVAPKADLLTIMEGDHVLGNPQADVKIFEYASLTCPHCMAYHLETFPQIKKEYIDTGKVMFVFRHFPLNDPALRGAMLAECSGDEQFYKYVNVLMKSQDKWGFSNNYMGALRNIAKIGGMGDEEFTACMENKTLQDSVLAKLSMATQQLGINATPTTFINGEKLNGFQTFEQIKKHLDPLLNSTPDTTAE
jgi:protein-disulfide isomerase